MKTSNISLLSCLLMTALLSTPANAQTEADLAKLVKNNSIEVCECFKQVDYIDDFSDFDIKFDQCPDRLEVCSKNLQDKCRLHEARDTQRF